MEQTFGRKSFQNDPPSPVDLCFTEGLIDVVDLQLQSVNFVELNGAKSTNLFVPTQDVAMTLPLQLAVDDVQRRLPNHGAHFRDLSPAVIHFHQVTVEVAGTKSGLFRDEVSLDPEPLRGRFQQNLFDPSRDRPELVDSGWLGGLDQFRHFRPIPGKTTAHCPHAETFDKCARTGERLLRACGAVHNRRQSARQRDCPHM